MVRLTRLLLLCGLLITISCARIAPVAPTAGPSRLSGSIFAIEDGRAGQPIPNAQLKIIEGVNVNTQATADAVGHYAFGSLERGRFTLNITAPGYVGLNGAVDLLGNIQADFALQRQ